ncbi:MAG: NHL repeat-containing protein, partial [Planctomycetota bacterium]|nr:NHL repeat-containing protein [Planctomycetota bacterium]
MIPSRSLPPTATLATLAGGLLLGVAVLWPLATCAALVWDGTPVVTVGEEGRATIASRTALWSLAVALAALVPGLPMGALLGRAIIQRSSNWFICSLTLLPVCIPGYAIFWCWWQSLGPGTRFGAWAIEQGLIVPVRELVLLVALASWSWPLVAWSIAISRVTRGRSGTSLAALDGATRGRRLGLWLRAVLPGALLGVLLTGGLVATATVSFDLAQVATTGFELRALDALGAGPAQLLARSMPSMAVSLVCAGLILLAVTGDGTRWAGALSRRMVAASRPGRGRWLLPTLLVVLGSLLPILLASLSIGSLDPGLFWKLYGPAVARTLLGAVVEGTLCAVVAGLLYLQLAFGGRRLQLLGILFCLGWLLAGRLPSTTLAAVMTGTFNTATLGPLVYDSGLVLVIAQVASLAGLGCLVAVVVARSEPSGLRELRRLDPPRPASVTPGLLATMLLAFAVTGVFSLGELVLPTRLGLPGRERLATGLLNGMHYQRPDTVMLGLLALLGGGWLLAMLLGRAVSRRLAGPFCLLVMALPSLLQAGCTERAPQETATLEGDPPVPHELVFGAPGAGPGLFKTPRGIAVDPRDGAIFVVDKTARIQRFAPDGTFLNQWSMPEVQVGKPVGISVSPDGRVFVPDTHYHRIIVFDASGNELDRFGSFGTGPGQFVYPTDVAFGADGELYVSEYGTNDRVQVFDSDGRFLRAFGASGRGDGQFTR